MAEDSDRETGDAPESPSTDAAPEEDTRRAFLKTAGLLGLGAGLGAVIVVPAGGAIVYPLTHTTVSGSDAFIPVGDLERFASDEPVKVDLFADKRDAWNRVVQVKVGSAWVVREGEKLTAYSTVCPHLGCAIDYDAEKNRFKCPCHRSAFTLDGKVTGGPAPRDMDRLDVKQAEGKVSIRYQRFKQGIGEKEPV